MSSLEAFEAPAPDITAQSIYVIVASHAMGLETGDQARIAAGDRHLALAGIQLEEEGLVKDAVEYWKIVMAAKREYKASMN